MLKNFNLLRISLAVLILAIPLYPKFPISEVSGTYVNLRLDDIIVFISILFLVIHQLKSRFPIFKNKLFLLFLSYWFALLSAVIGSIVLHQIERPAILLLNAFRRIEYMSLFFLSSAAVSKKEHLKIPFLLLITALLGAGTVGLGQKYFSWPIISTMNQEFSKGQLLYMSTWTRISSTFAGHYDLAVYTSVALVILGGSLFLCKNLFSKIIIFLSWISTFYILTLTASRISLFAFYAGMSLSLVLIRKYFWILPLTILIIATIATTSELNQRLLATVPGLRTKIAMLLPKYTSPTTPAPNPTQIPTLVTQTPIAVVTGLIPTAYPTPIRIRPVYEYPPVDADAGVARSGQIRFQVEWPRAINALKKNPVQGTGPGSITLATDNDYLRILGETGIFGLITFISIFVWFFLQTKPFLFYKQTNDRNYLNYIFLASIFTMFANAVFIDVFAASKIAYSFWILMGIYYQNLQFCKHE